MRCELAGTELRLYRGKQKNLFGYLYTGDYRIQVIVMDGVSRTAVVFIPFTWQGSQWKQDYA